MYLELDGNRSTCLTTEGSYPNEQFRLIAAAEPYAISRIVIEYKHNSRFRVFLGFFLFFVFVCLFVCLFVFVFVLLLVFFLGGGWLVCWLQHQILTLTRHTWPLSCEGHTCCNTGHPFIIWASPRTRDTRTCCRAFGSGAVTT